MPSNRILGAAMAAASALAASWPGAARADGPANGARVFVEEGSPSGFRVEIRPPEAGARPVSPSGELGPPKPASRRNYKRGDPIPHGHHLEERPIYGLMKAGSVTFGISYVIGAVVGLSMGHRGTYAVIPIVGPFVAAATDKSPAITCEGGGCLGEIFLQSLGVSSGKGWLYTAGVVQIIGGALIVAGAGARRWTLERDRAPSIVPVPLITSSSVGLGVAGSF
jgi:hypothetical protein